MFKWGNTSMSDGMSIFMEGVQQFNDYIMCVIIFVFCFVVVLVCCVVARISGDREGGGGLVVEVVWTVLPIVILVLIAYPSIVLLYVDRGLGFKGVLDVVGVCGYQWY